MTISDNILNLRRGLIVLAIIFPVLYFVFAGVSVVQDYQTTMGKAESDVRNIAVALGEHATRTIGEADSLLQSAIDDIERRGLAVPGPDEVEIHNILKWYTQKLPQSVNFSVIDAQGWYRVSGLNYPMAPIDVRDREYFKHHATAIDPDLFISRPIKGRTTEIWSFILTRRVNNPDGSLKMVVGMGIAVNYFDHFYRSLEMGEDSRLQLIRQDGWILTQSPFSEGALGKNFKDGPLFRHFSQAPVGYFHNPRSSVDGTKRVIGYAGSAPYPVLAAVSMSSDFVLRPWYRRVGQIGLIGVISISLMLALIALLWRRLSDLQDTQNNLTRQNAALLTSEGRYQELVDGIDGIVWEADLPDFRFTYVSGNAGAISGYPAEAWLSNPDFWREKLATTDDGQREAILLACRAQSPLIAPIEHHIVALDGREIWLRSNVMVAAGANNAPRLRGVMVDITRQKISEKDLYRLAHFDLLTGLPNRQTLSDRIGHAIVRSSRDPSSLAVMFIDVDHFKTINDSLGHEAGDQVLRTVAQRIGRCLRQSDTVARIGGDEFVVLLEEIDNHRNNVEQITEKLAGALAEAIHVNDNELYVALSMGISVFPQDGQDGDTLLKNADTAMYRAKMAGRNCWRFFDESMAQHATHRLKLETALRHAVDRDELLLHYQPQRALDGDRIVGVEALLRWSRPGMGIVPPLEFIPLAEESGLILPIGNWVLKTACTQAATWLNEKNLRLRIAVNIAAKQIHHKEFVAQVRKTLDETGLPPELLELEITESSIMENLEESVSKLHQLKALGVTVAVDDFGTGYSSLSYLKQLPIDRLKIDRSFVKDTPDDADDCAIVRTIIAMANNLGMDVIAEGVETREQMEFLRREGCNEIQGYFLCQPLPPHELEEKLI